MLLQIMDEGTLTDSYGRHVSFRNVILIMTSNLSARSIEKNMSLGFQSASDEESSKKMDIEIRADLKRHFSPEFLNRIDEVVIFNKLKRESIERIIDLQLDKLRSRLFEEKMILEISDAAKNWLVDKGYDPAYGARPLKRALQKFLENPISDKILAEEMKAGSTVFVDLQDDKLVLEEKSTVESY
jgi:ATP-dependent Clp protease ATP-binding subunit ClpC